jgi:nitrite reductase (NO-forming)
MNKDGKEVTGASIRADGKIQLSDGTIVTPAFDLRSTTDSRPTPVTTKPSEHVVIDVAGIDFEYDIKQIKVKKGDTVTINFKSNKGFHDWVVDEFNAATERVTEKDGITSVTFVADKVGTFQYYCSVMNHRQMGMIGYLIVEEK